MFEQEDSALSASSAVRDGFISVDGNLFKFYFGDMYHNIPKLKAGLLSIGCPVFSFSYRDLRWIFDYHGRLFRSFSFPQVLERAIEATRAPVVLLEHLPRIDVDKMRAIRARTGVEFVHINVDPPFLPKNEALIATMASFCSRIFMTSEPGYLARLHPNCRFHFLPNLVSDAIEGVHVGHTPRDRDVVLAVRRTKIAGGRRNSDFRVTYQSVVASATDVNWHVLDGFLNPNFYGRKYLAELARAKIGLDLSATRSMLDNAPVAPERMRWYASDRLSHLFGIGTCVMAYRGFRWGDFLKEGVEFLPFDSWADAIETIREYAIRSDKWQRVADKGRIAYRELFNEKRVAEYVLATIEGRSSTLGDQIAELREI